MEAQCSSLLGCCRDSIGTFFGQMLLQSRPAEYARQIGSCFLRPGQRAKESHRLLESPTQMVLPAPDNLQRRVASLAWQRATPRSRLNRRTAASGQRRHKLHVEERREETNR